MLKHAVIIKWSDEDHGYIATIPGIQGLSAFGKSQKEALAELNVAAEAFFASLEEHRKTVPLPIKISDYSGQLRLRMPKSLHAELAEAAENDGVSLNTYIVTLLSKRSVQQAIMKKMERVEGVIIAANARIISDAASKMDTSLGGEGTYLPASNSYFRSERTN